MKLYTQEEEEKKGSCITLKICLLWKKFSPVLSSSRQEGAGNHTAQSSYIGKTDSSCRHRMETAGLPSDLGCGGGGGGRG